jgi:hypothetical protein
MSKRARYTGNPPGRTITWPPGAVYPEQEWFIEPNHLLPDDAPAKLRDELIANDPDFSEVEQTTTSKKGGDE